MPTSYDEFRQLPFEQQLPLAWDEGTYLAQRWEEEDAVGLYHMDGNFFVEVYYDQKDNRILRLQCFTDSAILEDYSHGISLGDLTT